MKDIIPHPYLESWMHKRINIFPETKEQIIKRYMEQEWYFVLADNIISRLVKILKMNNQELKYGYYRAFMKLIHIFFRIHNRIEIKGIENIPKAGAIFILNHQGAQDPIILLSSLKFQVSIFTDVGTGFLADVIENLFHFVARRGKSEIMIEKMIRSILLKNRYIAIWPAGHPPTNNGSAIGQGFSGIVKVYATVNSKKNIIPFVPIIMQNCDSFWWGERRKASKIVLTVKKPIFIERTWLNQPNNKINDGGKTPREIIDFLMLSIAENLGQKKLVKNPLLERRKRERKEGKINW